MNILVDKKFYGGVPTYLRHKLDNFISRLSSNPNDIFTHGNYCRKIRGTDNKYKFRVNSGDRVVFQYEQDAIRLLRFCNHDEQIRVAERLNANFFDEQELDASYNEYVEDKFDYQIDQDILSDIQNHLLEDKLNLALAKLKSVGAAQSKKAQNIRKIITIDEGRSEFFAHKAYVSKIFIRCSKVENSKNEKVLTTLRRKDIRYAFNRMIAETKCLIHPFVYFQLSGADYLRDAFLEGLADKRKIAEAFADFFVKEVESIANDEGIIFFVILKDADGKIIPSQNIEICPYEKTFHCHNDDGIVFMVQNTLGAFANNYRLIKSKEKIKSINLSFLGLDK